MDSPRDRRDRAGALGLLVRVVIAFALVAVMTHTLVRPFVIPSGSMEPTLRPGDRVAVRVVGVEQDSLDRGQVFAFAHGRTWEEDRIDEPNRAKDLLRTAGDVVGVGPSHHAHTVKRVIGLPRERVSCCDAQGRLLVDGEPLDEPYVGPDLPFADGGQDCTAGSPSRSARCFPETTVPKDSYLVLGDHRADSSDSVAPCRGRAEGSTCPARFVRADQVVGLVAWRWWPLPPGDALREG